MKGWSAWFEGVELSVAVHLKFFGVALVVLGFLLMAGNIAWVYPEKQFAAMAWAIFDIVVVIAGLILFGMGFCRVSEEEVL